MIRKPWNTHKHTRISPNWGEEYTYYERNKQLAKAQRMAEEHHHERRQKR